MLTVASTPNASRTALILICVNVFKTFRFKDAGMLRGFKHPTLQLLLLPHEKSKYDRLELCFFRCFLFI